MNELDKYAVISAVIGGVYTLSYFGWQVLKRATSSSAALDIVGKIAMWLLGTILILLVVGSIILHSIRSVSHAISQTL
jgi:hypothetical protein